MIDPELFDRLVKLQLDHGFIWTFGSGEASDTLFSGIAHPADSEEWKDKRRWFCGNDPNEVIRLMVELNELRAERMLEK